MEVVEFFKTTDLMHIALWRYAVLLGWIFLGLAAGRIAVFVLDKTSQRLKKRTRTEVLGLMLGCLGKPAALGVFAGALRAGLAVLKARVEKEPGMFVLEVPEGIERVGGTAVEVVFAVAIAYGVYRLVDVVDHFLRKWAARTETAIDDMLAPLLRKSMRITVVIVAGMFIVQLVYGKTIGELLVGLGVGGLAVALAGQDMIRNFFGSVMILLDKPFQVGDRVVIGGHDGPVEEVGFRSTKIRTLEGHLVTVPNAEAANTIVQNIGRRPYIRRLSNITITYDTPPEKVKRALEIIKEILTNHEGMDEEFPPRVFFNDFNDCSLNILMLYWYHPPDYWAFLAFNEKVNMELLERFNAEGIDFAFPTQTVYLANDEKRQLALRMLEQGTDIRG